MEQREDSSRSGSRSGASEGDGTGPAPTHAPEQPSNHSPTATAPCPAVIPPLDSSQTAKREHASLILDLDLDPQPKRLRADGPRPATLTLAPVLQNGVTFPQNAMGTISDPAKMNGAPSNENWEEPVLPVSAMSREQLEQEYEALKARTEKQQADLLAAERETTRLKGLLEFGLEQRANLHQGELTQKNDLLMAEVAERERAQAELRSAKEVAESATVQKSQFLANMSHEIRTPFNAVVALAGLLLDTQLNPLQTDYVETIKNSSQELLVVINDILDYSKIELDHLSMSKDRVQIRSVVESSMDMLAERAASKGIEMALVLEEGDIQFIGDVTRLRQIVVNLLSNAVKFTSTGEIIVTAWSEPVETPPGEEPQVRVRVSVKDTGIGIARENFGKLFRIYSQVDGSETTKVFGGTGLGLAISRKLSLLMRGDLSVESDLGHGATFTLDFVAQASKDDKPDLYSAAQNPDFVGKRCLVVDSNHTSRKVLQQLITSFGLEVDAPEDISDAYGVALDAQVAGKPHDVLLVDAFLPGFAAQVLLRRLRQKNIKAPAVALTRMGSPIYEEMRQLDCRFLIKPIKRNRLHHTLRDVFPANDVRPSPPPLINSTLATNLSGRNPLTILCAEDNPINVKVITHVLKRLGYTTDIAEDGQVAYEKAMKKKYDVIFMDVNMPRMNGLESTRRICESMPDKETRPLIVAMTALAMTSDKEMCLNAGCDAYVSKPILVPDLVAALHDASVKAYRHRARPDDAPLPAPSVVLNGAVPFELELPTPARRFSAKREAQAKSTANPPSGPAAPFRGPPLLVQK